MTEAEFDKLLTVFLWRDAGEMDFDEITRAFSIALLAKAIAFNELKARGEIGDDGEIPILTPQSREVESLLENGFMTTPGKALAEGDVHAHMRFVFEKPLSEVDTESLVRIISAASGACDRIADVLNDREMLYTKDPAFIHFCGADDPIAEMKKSNVPYVIYRIPKALHVDFND